MQIQFINPFDEHRDGDGLFFREGELIQIWADEAAAISTPTTAQLVMDGVIQSTKHRISGIGRVITIDAMDRTYMLLHGIWTKNYTNTAFRTSPDIIKNVVEHLSGRNRTYKITTSNVASTLSGGGAFKKIDYSIVGKSGYEIIKELSQPENTGDDRSYIFWINKDNDLYWTYPTQTSTSTIQEGQNNIYDFTASQGTWDVVNFVIFNAGTDMNNVGVLWYLYDENTDQPDLRMKYEPMTDIAKNLKEQERIHMSDRNISQGTDGYPDVYNYTFSWNSITESNRVLTETTTAEIASSDSDYNDKFRLKCKYEGLKTARRITQLHGQAKTKLTIRMKGNNDFTTGQFLTFKTTSGGLKPSTGPGGTDIQRLRIHQITHQYNANGWMTTLNMQEDEKQITLP